MPTPNRFVAGDWGTTQLRLWLCEADRVIDTRSGLGISKLQQSPAAHFAALVAEWRSSHGPLPALLCGMVGSRNGWREVPYVACPASGRDLQQALTRIDEADVDVAIVPGLSCTTPAGAPDVMRGEETQVIGALALRRELQHGTHLLALPGTHTKWVWLVEGRVESFQTAFTGEMYALLRDSTLLRAATPSSAPFDGGAFDLGVSQARGHLLHALFQTRSRQLIDGLPAGAAASFLSGLLIGSDVRAALATLSAPLPQTITLIGEPALTAYYARALRTADVASVELDGGNCVLAGLRTLVPPS